jgi:hypothetical protein
MSADRGRPQGGAKSEAGRAAYWRMQYESAIGALADLIAEHTETVETFADLRAKVDDLRERASQGQGDGYMRNEHRVGQEYAYEEVLALIDEATP